MTIIVTRASVKLTWKVISPWAGSSPPATQTSCGRGKCSVPSTKQAG